MYHVRVYALARVGVRACCPLAKLVPLKKKRVDVFSGVYMWMWMWMIMYMLPVCLCFPANCRRQSMYDVMRR